MQLTKRMKAKGKANGTPCWLCGRPINYSAHWNDPWAPVVDEVVPRSKGGKSTNEAGCRLAHRWCNGSRGNRPPVRLNGPPTATQPAQPALRTSEAW
jgi:5-methylcytosine-specific restriction endonuclease McrA